MSVKALVLMASAPLIAWTGPAQPVASTPLQLDTPAYETPARERSGIGDERSTPETCRDRIHKVREERGLPKLDRRTENPDEPVMIYAVDRRESGCAVMVVAGNPDDIRPPPEPDDRPLFQRIEPR